MWLAKDAEAGAWTLHTEQVVLDSAQALEAWEKQLFDVLTDGLGEQRVPLLIDMGGFHLDPSMANSYGPIAKRVLTGFATAIVRYSPDGTLTKAGVRTAAIKSGFASNICDSRETALELLSRIRAAD